MPAVEVINGQALFSIKRQAPWLGLGTEIDADITDYQTMMDATHLSGWNVRKAELSVVGHKGVKVPEVGIIRTNPINGGIDLLGVVGGKYGIVQNEVAFSALQSLADGATWESAGALHGGKKVFATVSFDRQTVVDPNGVGDIVRNHLILSTSHDGSGKLKFGAMASRLVCWNALNVTLRNLSSEGSVRHTLNVENSLAIAAEAWRSANKYFDAFDIEAQRLFETPLTDAGFQGAVETLYPRPEASVKGALAKWEARVELNTTAWKGAPNAGIRGTKWGGVNALVEANQWGRRLRGSNDDGSPTSAALENYFAAGAGFDRPTNAFRQRALEVVEAI